MATASPARSTLVRIVRGPRGPLLALALVSVLSLGARALMLDEPCQAPCTQAGQHTLIFDEAYYVNAARVIAGIHPPAGSHYADSPLGTDPNAEHPAGAKLIMAGAIELFGDGPFAWRIGSLIMGTLAILGMYALVRCAGGDSWPAAGAAALMAADNLLLVMGRIGTLDIYAVAAIVWGVALYLWGRPFFAGVVLAVATCFKEVSPFALLILGLVEVGRVLVAWREPGAPPGWRWRPALGRLVAAGFTTAGVFVGLLSVMDLIVTPYADSQAKLITGGPFTEIHHIISYAAGLTAPHGLTGIASYPWEWLIDLKPILYLRINPSLPGHGLYGIHPVAAFWGMMSPVEMLLAVPAVVFCGYRLARGRGRGSGLGGAGVGVAAGAGEFTAARWFADRQLAILGVAWFIGTWVPFALQSVLDSRITYLYYMVIVMPGMYVAIGYMVTMGWRRRIPWLRGVTLVWALGVAVAVVLMYPFLAIF